MFAKFWRGWKKGFGLVGGTIGSTVNLILVTFIYFIGVGPVALVAKLFRKQFLPFSRRNEKVDSYWIPRKQQKKGGFERLF